MHVGSVVQKEGYVEVKIVGDYAGDDLGALFKSVLSAVDRPGIPRRLLLDSREVGGRPPTTLERYEISIKALGLPKGVRIAMLPRPDAIDPDRFGEKVAHNRGLSFSVFTDEAAALTWLLGST